MVANVMLVLKIGEVYGLLKIGIVGMRFKVRGKKWSCFGED